MPQAPDTDGGSLLSRLRAGYRALVPLSVRRSLWEIRNPRSDTPVETAAPAVQEPEDIDEPMPEVVASDAHEADLSHPPVAYTPSYVYKWGESLRLLREIRSLSETGDPIEHPVNRAAFKLRGYALAESLGIRHPEVYGVFARSAEVDWTTLPQRFVVKSKWGCVSQRVLLIERRGALFASLRSEVAMTQSEFAEWLDDENGFGDPSLDQVSYTSGESGFWFEQLLDPPPFDWKVYSFDGDAGLIICIDRDGKRYRTFDAGFRPSDGAFSQFPFEESSDLPEPAHGAEILSAAGAMSRAVGHPHVSIDLYDMPEGVYFGEATAIPGGGQFLQGEADARLGALWEQADARLTARGLPPFAHLFERY